MQTRIFRIIIIDDNIDIHKDFIKILKVNRNDKQLDELEAKIFSNDNSIQNDSSSKDQKIEGQIFEIETAKQGQEGVEKIRLALEAGVGQSHCIYTFHVSDCSQGLAWEF